MVEVVELIDVVVARCDGSGVAGGRFESGVVAVDVVDAEDVVVEAFAAVVVVVVAAVVVVVVVVAFAVVMVVAGVVIDADAGTVFVGAVAGRTRMKTTSVVRKMSITVSVERRT